VIQAGAFGTTGNPGMVAHGYVRGGHGDLLQWDIATGSCRSVGGQVVSAPSPIIPISDNIAQLYRYDAVYKGANGNLWYYNDAHRCRHRSPLNAPRTIRSSRNG
jgi:hypothetical protein